MHLGLEVLKGGLGVNGVGEESEMFYGTVLQVACTAARGCACIHTWINIINKLPLCPERYTP